MRRAALFLEALPQAVEHVGDPLEQLTLRHTLLTTKVLMVAQRIEDARAEAIDRGYAGESTSSKVINDHELRGTQTLARVLLSYSFAAEFAEGDFKPTATMARHIHETSIGCSTE